MPTFLQMLRLPFSFCLKPEASQFIQREVKYSLSGSTIVRQERCITSPLQQVMGCLKTAFVVVTILDENDNRPEFSNSLFFASIEENMLPNSPVIQLNATDADISVNAEITYTVESSTPENHFGINPTTGQLYTLQLLDRENISEYLVTILATDSGVPALSTSVQVNVSVQDTNDLAPVFVGTPYLVQVEENSLQSGAIFTVQADDGDVLTNAEIFFTLAGVEPEITGAFEINETSGELF